MQVGLGQRKHVQDGLGGKKTGAADTRNNVRVAYGESGARGPVTLLSMPDRSSRISALSGSHANSLTTLLHLALVGSQANSLEKLLC